MKWTIEEAAVIYAQKAHPKKELETFREYTREDFIAGAKSDAAKEYHQQFTSEEISFIETALNHYWNHCHCELQRRGLGDIEREMNERLKEASMAIMLKIQRL